MLRLAVLDVPKEKQALISGLGYISTAMTYLDIKKSAQGNGLYSYPSSIQTSCDNSKPYHFWMSAFLARRVTQITQNPNAGVDAAFIAEKAYQFKSHLGGAKSGQSYISNAVFTCE